MQSLNFLIGIIVLILGFPIGNYLAKKTEDERSQGQLWFKLIILASFVGAVLSIIFGNDSLLFAFLFIIIITSRSLRKKK
ncbi:MAG: hypothetical protein KJ905_02105 [Nanoarchaeota archaeon]|nr:hypothetical protein [Nanoarchaeota archaeon]MBU1501546.1 hypothetical protein [Nanoarchaeota archaeon]MBU2459151.1 hypothetical protein [Nanoarchaeota archaeon]